MIKRKYNVKRTISMKLFISQLGTELSPLVKERLMDLEVRCVLTRKEDINILDLKHVEHKQNNSDKEYVYGQFIIVEDALYFSENITETDGIMKSPIVGTIYNSLDSKDMITNETMSMKKVDDSNIGYIVDTILTVCPPVSQQYLDIVHDMLLRIKD